MIARPHDLLRIDPRRARDWDAPSWVVPALERAPWVVVRRTQHARGLAVGVRGSQRCERYAASIEPDDVLHRWTPYDLRSRIGREDTALDRAAQLTARAAQLCRIVWGPAGAYGFELASGARVTHAASDLDGIIAGAARERLRDFASVCAHIHAATGVRLDFEVQIDGSGVALDEVLGDAARVLAKTSGGAALIALDI
ncbi:MAG: malonate decarboxylase holo-ACP synthase [Candidatus Velthaea sp.]